MSETFSSADQTLKDRRDNQLLIVYVASAAFVLALIILSHYYVYGIFGTSLLLGWDSPGYVWLAKEVIAKSPMYMIGAWSYPQLYLQLLALFGYLTGNVLDVERVLPMFFAILLIYANSRITLEITNRIHVAGLAALLTVLSLNFLRVLADLNRNLMALSLSMIAFLLVPRLGNIQPFQKRNYLFFIFLLLIIASTHFETYFVFSLSLVLYGVLSRNLKKALKLTLASAVPVVVLVLLFYPYFVGYMSTIVTFERRLTFNDVFSWTGSSWLLLGLLIVGLSYLYREAKQRNKLGRLILCWFFVLILLATLSGLCGILPAEFALRILFLLPTPLVLALSVPGCEAFLRSLPFASAIRRKFSTHIDIRRLFLLIVTFCLLTSSAFVVLYRADEFLAPCIPYSGYEKVLTVTDFLAKNGLSKPVIVFYGEPGFWFNSLYRNYIGMEIGEHFAYYGNLEDLLHLTSSKPKITYDPHLMKVERYYSGLYYQELLGNWSGPPPTLYFHERHIKSVEDLMSYPIVVVTPDFYNNDLPYYMKPYHIGGGIYVIPPHSPINLTEVVYGPEITIRRDSTINGMRSQYSHIDPYDPSLVYLKLNCSSGYQSYNLTNLPSNLTFAWMEQGNDLSYPEHNPIRFDGTKAVVGNDPTESAQYWTTPMAEQEATFQIDPSTKKEGNSSLRITGKTDSWGSLIIRYNSPGTLNLAGYSSIDAWVKCNESAVFSITLVDRYGGSRIFWAIRAGGSSAATSWKRFVANLTEYTSQTPGFRIDSVDHIDLFVSSSVGKNLSFWIDDLTVDTPLNLNAYVYKDRVPTNETLIIHLYMHMRDIPNTAKTNKNNRS